MQQMLDTLLVLTPITMVFIALGLACALRIACRRRTGASRAGLCQAAGDPFFFPFGEVPISSADQAIANYRRELREDDFRAWGLPPTRPAFGRRGLEPDASHGAPSLAFSSVLAPRRKSGDGGCPDRTAVVLGFRGRDA